MSITNKLNQIKNAIYGKEVRGAIHDAIKECYDDASVNHDNANMEVKMARGTHNTLNDRLNKSDEIQAQTNAQLSEVAFNVSKLSANAMMFGAKANANYYNELDGNYYEDESYTIPANDDTEAIQKCIDYAKDNKINAYFPGGNYLITSTVTIYNKMTIKGCGMLEETRFVSNAPIDMFATVDKPSSSIFMIIKDIRVCGDNKTTKNGFIFKSSSKSAFVLLENVYVSYFTESCITVNDMGGWQIKNLRVSHGGNFGMKIVGANENSIVENSWFTDSETPLYIEGGSSIRFNNCYMTTEFTSIETKPTKRLIHLVNTSFMSFNECNIEAAVTTDAFIEDVLIDRDKNLSQGDVDGGTENVFNRCTFLTHRKNGHHITIGSDGVLAQGITSPTKTKILRCEFIQALDGYYDVNIHAGLYTRIFECNSKVTYRTMALLPPKIYSRNDLKYYYTPFEGLDSGTNGATRWVKFDDGTMIVYTKLIVDCTNNVKQTMTLPVEFYAGARKNCSISVVNILDRPSREALKNITVGMTNSTTNVVNIFNDNESSTITDLELSLMIVGQWKLK